MKRTVISASVLALAVAGVQVATAAPGTGFKVTGGGQALATSDSSSVKGPGDTYGFNAQQIEGATADAAKGQFNSIQRDAGATVGRGKGEHIKGEVTCLVATGDGTQGTARFGGVIRGSEFQDMTQPSSPTEQPRAYTDRMIFIVDVTDNGEGQAEDDLIQYDAQEEDADDDGDPTNDPNPCDDQRTLAASEETILARGNVQVKNAAAEEETSTETTSTGGKGKKG